MAIGPVTLAYGAAATFVCGLSIVATLKGGRPDRNALAISVLLFLTYVASNACHMLPRDMRTAPYPYIDTISAFICVTLWYTDGDEVPFWHRAWELALAFTFLTETILHASMPEPWREPFRAQYAYDLSLNLTFALQLIIGASPGSLYVGAAVRDIMRRHLARRGVRSSVAR